MVDVDADGGRLLGSHDLDRDDLDAFLGGAGLERLEQLCLGGREHVDPSSLSRIPSTRIGPNNKRKRDRPTFSVKAKVVRRRKALSAGIYTILLGEWPVETEHLPRSAHVARDAGPPRRPRQAGAEHWRAKRRRACLRGSRCSPRTGLGAPAARRHGETPAAGREAPPLARAAGQYTCARGSRRSPRVGMIPLAALAVPCASAPRLSLPPLHAPNCTVFSTLRQKDALLRGFWRSAIVARK